MWFLACYEPEIPYYNETRALRLSGPLNVNAKFRELAALYKAILEDKPASLQELPLQYAEYATWQRERLQGERLEQHLAYWRRQLDKLPELLDLPTDRPRPPLQSHKGDQYIYHLPASLTQALIIFSRQNGVTLFMLLLAAFKVLLYRYSGQTDIVVGTPIAGRTRQETETLIGFFVNTLVLRDDLSGEPTLSTLLRKIRSTALDAYTYQELPFEKLVGHLAFNWVLWEMRKCH